MPHSARLRAYAIAAWAAIGVIYHLYLIYSGLIPNLVSRPLHLVLALPWIFIIGTGATFKQRLFNYLLCGIGLLSCAYIILQHDALSDQYGALQGYPQLFMAIALILIVLEMARRAIKLALPLVAGIALLYGLFGQYLPGEFGHPGIPLNSFLGTLVITEGGLWGQLTGISVNVIAVFVILGALISAGEGGSAFMAMASRLAGQLNAGAAKVAVLASALFGSISGSASANVASTGAITLPTMKRLGYPSSFAAAVEAVASSGGQIMPPLMGAGAFIMVELLRVQYTDILTAAVLPALLFFCAAWFGVGRFAQRYQLRAMNAADIPSWGYTVRLAPFFLLPFGVLLGMLFLTQYTAQFAAANAALLAALLLLTNEHGQLSIKRWGQQLQRACINAAQQMATIAAIIICAGIIIGVLHLTGVGIKVTSVIISLSSGQLWLALLLTALACLILGMEVPTTAAYVICVSVAGPALQELGLPTLHTHLFVFWYALLSTITPPVCGTVFIAASMANAPWLTVAGQAMRLGLGLYIVPLAFIANPALLHPDEQLGLALLAAGKIAAGLWCLSTGLINDRFRLSLRLMLVLVGLMCIFSLKIT